MSCFEGMTRAEGGLAALRALYTLWASP